MERNLVPLISGTRSVPRSFFEKRNAFPFRSSKKWNAFQERRSLERVPKALLYRMSNFPKSITVQVENGLKQA